MSSTLLFLLEQSKEKVQQAQLALNQANIELADYYQQVAQIEKYRLDYCQQLVDRGKQGLTASQYGHLNRFLTQLDHTLSKQKEAEAQFKQQVENCQQHWLAMRKEHQSYQWLIDKKDQQAKTIAARKEQKAMDEFSTLMSTRRKIVW